MHRNEICNIDIIWKGLDFHQDGKINYTEFLAATMSSLNFSKEEEIWSAFKYFEETKADKEGTISIESLFKALRASISVWMKRRLEKDSMN